MYRILISEAWFSFICIVWVFTHQIELYRCNLQYSMTGGDGINHQPARTLKEYRLKCIYKFFCGRNKLLIDSPTTNWYKHTLTE